MSFDDEVEAEKEEDRGPVPGGGLHRPSTVPTLITHHLLNGIDEGMTDSKESGVFSLSYLLIECERAKGSSSGRFTARASRKA